MKLYFFIEMLGDGEKNRELSLIYDLYSTVTIVKNCSKRGYKFINYYLFTNKKKAERLLSDFYNKKIVLDDNEFTKINET